MFLKDLVMIMIILIVVVAMMLLGSIPRWPHSREWGYYPSSGLGLLLVVLVNDFLVKPLGRDTLVAKITRLLAPKTAPSGEAVAELNVSDL
jgi:hypothetical protein